MEKGEKYYSCGWNMEEKDSEGENKRFVSVMTF